MSGNGAFCIILLLFMVTIGLPYSLTYQKYTEYKLK